MNRDEQLSDTTSFRKICLLLLMFTILFVVAPYSIHIRNTYAEIQALLYWIDFTNTGMVVDAPFPSRNFSSIPSHFWWMNLLQICFSLSVLLHFSGLISRRNTLIAGGIGLVTPVLTFIMNGIGTLLTSNLIIVIPVPIPTLFGLTILRFKSLPEMELWLEESDNS